MSNPLISIVIPVYNAEAFLYDALMSIVMQTYKPIEIIVVDDGSIDRSSEIIKDIAKTELSLKYLKTDNRGVASALNRAIDSSSGDLIARMDADDISLPERLKRQKEFLDNNPNVGIVGSYAHTIDVSGNIIGISKKPVEPVHLEWVLLFSNPFIHPTVMFRAHILKKLGGYRQKKSEDYDLWVRAHRITEFANIPECLLKYRIHSGQVTKKLYDVENNESVFVSRSLIYDYYDLKNVPFEIFMASRCAGSLKWSELRNYIFFICSAAKNFLSKNNLSVNKRFLLKAIILRIYLDTKHLNKFALSVMLPIIFLWFNLSGKANK